MVPDTLPVIIQGGMGAAVSAWQLAQSVARQGQMGVVSGTALDVVFSRRLQLGDPGGHLRRALDDFPYARMAQRVLDDYFVPGGKSPDQPFRLLPLPAVNPSRQQLELLVVANFAEVWLAREGHDGSVGINYLEKIQLPTLPSLFGAILAGVDFVLMGAGIPRSIPGILDQLCQGQPVELKLHVAGAEASDNFVSRFDPQWLVESGLPWLRRPRFLAIVASASLATLLARKSTGHVDGFVVEGPTAGGHNAPPRGALRLNDRGEPLYGPRDEVVLEPLRALERPFWLAGGYGSPERVAEALEQGATGVQIGTAFAYCEESGLRSDLKRKVIEQSRRQAIDVRTDPLASPTGFPFKIVSLDETMSQPEAYTHRERRCDVGFLREAYRQEDGSIGWRCPAERVETFVKKGGAEADTDGRKCLCNGLLANVGLQQVRHGVCESPLVTSGDQVTDIARFLPDPSASTYHARDVIEYLLSQVASPCGICTETSD